MAERRILPSNGSGRLRILRSTRTFRDTFEVSERRPGAPKPHKSTITLVDLFLRRCARVDEENPSWYLNSICLIYACRSRILELNIVREPFGNGLGRKQHAEGRAATFPPWTCQSLSYCWAKRKILYCCNQTMFSLHQFKSPRLAFHFSKASLTSSFTLSLISSSSSIISLPR